MTHNNFVSKEVITYELNWAKNWATMTLRFKRDYALSCLRMIPRVLNWQESTILSLTTLSLRILTDTTITRALIYIQLYCFVYLRRKQNSDLSWKCLKFCVLNSWHHTLSVEASFKLDLIWIIENGEIMQKICVLFVLLLFFFKMFGFSP